MNLINGMRLGLFTVLLVGATSLFAGPRESAGGITPQAKLKTEIAALTHLLSKGLDEDSQSQILIEIYSKQRSLKILVLQDKIDSCDYILATRKDLHQWRDMSSDKDGVTLVNEDRARYKAELDRLQAEAAAEAEASK